MTKLTNKTNPKVPFRGFMGKKLSTIILAALIFSSVSAQSIEGSWNGKIDVGGNFLNLVFHAEDSLATKVLMDSPDQHAFGILCDSSFYRNDSLYLSIKSIGMTVTGIYDVEKDSIFAVFNQMAFSTDLALGRGNIVKEKIVRPQDPVDFPYHVEEVRISSVDDVVLAGTLTMPNEQTNVKYANKIVVLISGSGAQNRNEELFDHRPFLVLSDFLTRNGIAVIRYDDRGTAESTGKFSEATTYDLSLDAEAVVNYIKSRDDLKNMSVGLIGHSEGGMIAPMIASRNSDIDFIVSLAGPGIPISELMMHQNYDIMVAGNAPKEIIDIEMKSINKIYKVLKNNKLDDDKMFFKIVSIKEKTYAKYPEGWMDKESIKQMSETEAESYLGTWLKYFATFNPQDYLKKTKVPVLALNGTNDIQVRAMENLEGIEKGLKKAKNDNCTIVPMPQLNHLFQKCLFGSINYYPKLDETFNEEAMKIIANWILIL
ncbi:alpha/beta fold hydrolase [Bacteroidales bacterium OttesenSCG-928-K03]|nr:alpha/beta fold hydrolase [Bacteroidales bacterium OttesenSCG-928-L14]MDL2241037.1 alpha/beta fold hydrolase [Bacteroidales bacterium OttesenSCG-928-K22]MDL2242671.1 alpha/beta fold hydrolase [Bacteroidales bacterium OttesenSCG-928-K03]